MIYNQKFAVLYDQTYALLRNQKKECKLITEVIVQNLKQNDSVLDIASGTGIHLSILNKKLQGAYKLIGIEGSLEMIAIAKKKLDNNVKLINGDLKKSWCVDDSSIDLSYAIFNLYQSFTDDEERRDFIEEIYRVLKKGGRLLIDSHCEPGFSKQHPKGSITNIISNDTKISIFSEITEDSPIKTTFVNFINIKNGEAILTGFHKMLKITYKQIINEFQQYGFALEKIYSNWDKSQFEETVSANCILIFIKI